MNEIQRYDEIEDSGGEIMPAQVQRVEISSLEAMTRAEIDRQIATAKAFPRSIDRVKKEIRELACANTEVAGACTYTLPARKGGNGKPTIGKSVRFAEIVAYAFMNIRISTRIIHETRTFVVAQAIAMDLERNTGSQFECHERILGFYCDDTVRTAKARASSIAYRNAVFDIVPGAIIDPIWMESRRLAAGKGRSIEDNRKGVLEWIKGLNVTTAELYTFLGVNGVDDITLYHLELLAGLKTSLETGMITTDSVFRPTAGALPPPDGQSKLDRLASNLGAQAAAIASPEHVAVAATMEAARIAPEPSPAPTAESTKATGKGGKTGSQGLFPSQGSGAGPYRES